MIRNLPKETASLFTPSAMLKTCPAIKPPTVRAILTSSSCRPKAASVSTQSRNSSGLRAAKKSEAMS